MAVVASTAALSAAIVLSFSVSVQSQKLQPLSISTSPVQNVEIVVDGHTLGSKSPLLTTDLSAGFHIITVRADNYRTQTVVFEHFPEVANNIHIDLVAEPIARLGSP